MTSAPTPAAFILVAWFCVGGDSINMQQAIAAEDKKQVRHLLSKASPAKCFISPRQIYGVRKRTIAQQYHFDTAEPYKVTFFEVELALSKKTVVTWTLERIPREV